MKKLIFAACTGIALASSASLAHAAIAQGKDSITPMVGYFNFADARNIKNDYAYGLGLAHYLTNNFGIELDLMNFDTKIKHTSNNVRGVYSTANAMYYFNAWHSFQPFVSAGAGVVTFSKSISPSTQFNIGAGVGVNYFITQNIALRVGGNDYFNFTQKHRNDVAASAGVSFLFGGCSSSTTTK